MAQKYAKGSRAWGICGRSGRKMLLRDMVFDGRYPNMRVDPAWYEDKHPQEFMPKVEDPTALYRPSPEVIAAPTAPVLTASLQGGTTAQLTWTPAESGITEIASYSIFRGLDGALPTLLITCAVLRDFLGGIVSVQHCTTTPSIPVDDTSDQPRPGDSSGSVFDKLTNEDAPVTYLDAGLTSGHTYCYYIVATPMGNNQSAGQGPPSPPSNTACVTAASLGTWTPQLGTSIPAGSVIDALIVSSTHIAALPQGSGFTLFSVDAGITWSQGAVPLAGAVIGWDTLRLGNADSVIIALAEVSGGRRLMRSTDSGQTYSDVTPAAFLASSGNLNQPVWSQSLLQWQMFASLTGNPPSNVWTSPDGVTWTSRDIVIGGGIANFIMLDPARMLDIPGAFLAAGTASDSGGVLAYATVVRSTDGITYTPTLMTIANGLQEAAGLAYDGTLVLALASDASNQSLRGNYTSSDGGVTWTQRTNPSSPSQPYSFTVTLYGGVAYSGFSPVNNTDYATSSDYQTWTNHPVAFGGGVFVNDGLGKLYDAGVGIDSTTDGTNWTSELTLVLGFVLNLHVRFGLRIAVGSDDAGNGQLWTHP